MTTFERSSRAAFPGKTTCEGKGSIIIFFAFPPTLFTSILDNAPLPVFFASPILCALEKKRGSEPNENKGATPTPLGIWHSCLLSQTFLDVA